MGAATDLSEPSDDWREGLPDLRPDARIVLPVASGIALLSFACLPPRLAFASALLGGLMAIGAEIDARLLLLPDAVTYGATGAGLLAAAWLHPGASLAALAAAAGRAALACAAVALLRWAYATSRKREGIGLGDVKLAAALGSWLPAPMIPIAFMLAAAAGLAWVAVLTLRDGPVDGDTKLPFGAFLCAATWLTFFLGAVLP